jgi:hypothetical protein
MNFWLAMVSYLPVIGQGEITGALEAHGSQHGSHGSTTTHGWARGALRSGWNREFQAYVQHSDTWQPVVPTRVAPNTNIIISFFMTGLLPIRVELLARRSGQAQR